jgi:hypothetical protein
VVLENLGFGFSVPVGTPAQLAATRSALRGWQVTVVVVPDPQHESALFRGDNPPFAAAFLTAAIGRAPVVQHGAWVWYGVEHRSPTLTVTPADLTRCANLSGPMHRVTDCVTTAAAAGG